MSNEKLGAEQVNWSQLYPWSQIHWFNGTGGDTYQTCAMYWDCGLPCRWCGRKPVGYGTTTVTWRLEP